MGRLQQVWDFFDGKKTAIGSACMMAGNIMQRYPQTAAVGSILQEVGFYTSGAGLVHKGVKAVTQ